MANTINDYVFELQWDGNKVTKGIDAIEARLSKLQKGVGTKLSATKERATSGKVTKSKYNAEKVLRDKQRALEAITKSQFAAENQQLKAKAAYEKKQAKIEADSEWQQLKAKMDQADHYQKRMAAAAKAQVKTEREKNAQLKALARQRTQESSFETARMMQIDNANSRIEKMNNLLARTSKIGGEAGSAFNASISQARQSLLEFQNRWGTGQVKSRRDLNTMKQQLIAITQQTKMLGNTVQQATGKFSVMQNVTKRIGATFLAMGASTMGAYALAGGVQASFAAAKEYEKLDIAMTAAFGSQQASNREMLYAEDVAKRYAIDIMAVGEGWSKISYAAKMSNMPIDQARQMFEDLAVSSRAFGLSADDTKGAMRAVIQMMGKGKVNAEDLRQQLAERIPAAIPMLAKSMGITVGELEDQMKAGLIPAEKLVGMFRLMAQDVKGSGALNKSLKSVGAAQTALSNASKRASKAFWGENAKGGFKDFMFMLTDFLDGNTKAIGQWGDTFAIAGKIILDTLGAIAPILSLVNTGFTALSDLLISTSTSTTQFGQLNALGRVLAMISWLIHDVKMAYEDLEKLLTGGEVVGGQSSIQASQKRANMKGIPVEEQIAWEAKYGNDLAIAEERNKSGQNSYQKKSWLEWGGRGETEWLASQAEKLNAMRSSLGGQDPYTYGAQSGSLSNMYRMGEKMTTNLMQGKLEFKVDASNVINLNKDGIADVSIPYGFQLGFNDSGGKNRGN